jgi:hypothetical protein
MHFAQLLKSLDELLYEIMSWLVFYPATLWRVLRHPVRMMDYSDRELHESDEEQYTDTLPPPLFLLVSLLLSHGLELALIGDSPLVASKQGLDALIDDDTSLIILRLVIFSLFPLIFAVRMVRLRGVKLTRDTLRQPFYAQCYAAAPFALAIGIAGTLIGTHWDWAPTASLAIATVALLLYGLVQTRWFAEHLKKPLWAGFGHASVGMIQSLIVVLIVTPFFA